MCCICAFVVLRLIVLSDSARSSAENDSHLFLPLFRDCCSSTSSSSSNLQPPLVSLLLIDRTLDLVSPCAHNPRFEFHLSPVACVVFMSSTLFLHSVCKYVL